MVYDWNNGKISGKDNRHLRHLLSKLVKRYNITNEDELPGKLREYLKLIPPFRMRLIANKLTVGSINKYFEELITPKRSKYEREVRIGQAIQLEDLLTGILELQNKKLNE